MGDVYLNDFEIFNNMFGDDLPPPPPGVAVLGPPPIPDPPIIPAGAQLGNDPPLALDIAMRYMRNQQPAGQALDAQGRNPGGFVGHHLQNFPEELEPLPDWRTLAEHNQQAENQRMVLNAIQGRMAERMRPRAQAINNEALRKDDPLGLSEFQAQVAAVQAAAVAAQRADLEAEMVLPNFIYPVVRQPPARNNTSAGMADKAADEKALGQAQENRAENRAERRRQLHERADRMFFHLDDYGAERRRLLDERIASLRTAPQDHEGERRRRAPENLDRPQIPVRGDIRNGLNERLDRLKAELEIDDDAEPAARRNDPVGARRVKEEFGDIFADIVPGEPVGGGDQGEAQQPRRRMWPRIGRQQEDPPIAALRQQQILDHEERKIQRSQQMARLRREQENDEAATARRLEILRRNNVAMRAAQPAIVLSDSPEPEVLSTGDEADEADDEGDFEPEIWF
jgi:hypothetical protein